MRSGARRHPAARGHGRRMSGVGVVELSAVVLRKGYAFRTRAGFAPTGIGVSQHDLLKRWVTVEQEGFGAGVGKPEGATPHEGQPIEATGGCPSWLVQ